MSESLAKLIALAIEEACAMRREEIAAICREEIEALRPAPTSGWLTPPRAAKTLGIGVRRVRALIDSGAVVTRARNLEPGKARQIKYEVNVASLEAALRSPTATTPAEPTNGKASPEAPWASEALAKKAARRSA